MTTYVPASDAVKADYTQLKNHLKAYTGKLTNFVEYNNDAWVMCNKHKMDDEIKSIIIDMLILNGWHNKVLCDQLGENHVPTDEQLDNILRFQTDVWNSWPYFTFAALRLINRNTKISDGSWSRFLQTNISKIQWADQCLEYVCDQSVDLIKQILDISKMTLSYSTLVAAYRVHNIPLINFHNMPVTTECVLEASKNGINQFVLDSITKLPPTNDTLSIMIKIKECTVEQVACLLQHVQPEQQHVKLACLHLRIDLIELLLNYRLTVDAECFKLMFFRGIKADPKDIENAIEQFILAGYQLTYNDVVNLARHKYHVRDIQRFNFTLDDKLINAYIMNNMIPPYDNLPYTIESLRFACQSNSTELIRKIIDSGITPDKQCLMNAILLDRTVDRISIHGVNSNRVLLLLPYVTCDEEIKYYLSNKF